MQQLLHYISKISPLSKEAIEYTSTVATTIKVKKGDKLIIDGQNVDKTFFVLDGCLRAYVFDKNGKEHTLQFATKEHWISDYIAIFNEEKSSQIVESITDSTIIEVSIKEGIENVFLRFPDLETLHRKNLQRHIVSLQKRILNQLRLSSLERYNLFLSQYPDIENHAPNYHIASYLGITQQSLSRLRATIVGK
jgi:CRP-like cAMP-binding protein